MYPLGLILMELACPFVTGGCILFVCLSCTVFHSLHIGTLVDVYPLGLILMELACPFATGRSDFLCVIFSVPFVVCSIVHRGFQPPLSVFCIGFLCFITSANNNRHGAHRSHAACPTPEVFLQDLPTYITRARSTIPVLPAPLSQPTGMERH